MHKFLDVFRTTGRDAKFFYTTRRARPFRILLLRVFLPPGVFVLAKKPWVFFLFFLFG